MKPEQRVQNSQHNNNVLATEYIWWYGPSIDQAKIYLSHVLFLLKNYIYGHFLFKISFFSELVVMEYTFLVVSIPPDYVFIFHLFTTFTARMQCAWPFSASVWQGVAQSGFEVKSKRAKTKTTKKHLIEIVHLVWMH